MRVLYRFVIDENPRFLAESRIYLRTILRAGVPARDVVAQVTARSGPTGRDLAASFGIRALELPLVPDGAYCNKINQLFTLAGEEFDVLIACDTDMATLRPLEAAVRVDCVRAKRPGELGVRDAEAAAAVRGAAGGVQLPHQHRGAGSAGHVLEAGGAALSSGARPEGAAEVERDSTGR